MFQATTTENLCDCLAHIEPVDLLGMRLLKEARPSSGLHPADLSRETLTQAVTEIVAYTGRCVQTAGRLRDLAPIPLTTIPILEFGL
jgi:hypothetical protein